MGSVTPLLPNTARVELNRIQKCICTGYNRKTRNMWVGSSDTYIHVQAINANKHRYAYIYLQMHV